MPSNRQLIPIILKNITPVLENLIERIAEDHDLDSKILKRKYLNELKTYKKKVSRRKGIINAYAAFLGDKSVEERLRKQNPDATFGELSKLKGPLWKSLSDDEKKVYKDKAKKQTECNLQNLQGGSSVQQLEIVNEEEEEEEEEVVVDDQ
tara:strand:- start:1526 stop:1975 length:450 start_codon:yes stop_codon:yes gene_type:complete